MAAMPDPSHRPWPACFFLFVCLALLLPFLLVISLLSVRLLTLWPFPYSPGSVLPLLTSLLSVLVYFPYQPYQQFRPSCPFYVPHPCSVLIYSFHVLYAPAFFFLFFLCLQ